MTVETFANNVISYRIYLLYLHLSYVFILSDDKGDKYDTRLGRSEHDSRLPRHVGVSSHIWNIGWSWPQWHFDADLFSMFDMNFTNSMSVITFILIKQIFCANSALLEGLLSQKMTFKEGIPLGIPKWAVWRHHRYTRAHGFVDKNQGRGEREVTRQRALLGASHPSVTWRLVWRWTVTPLTWGYPEEFPL